MASENECPDRKPMTLDELCHALDSAGIRLQIDPTKLEAMIAAINAEQVPLLRARVAELEALKPAAAWVPVGERMPEKGAAVFFLRRDNITESGYFGGDRWVAHDRAYFPLRNVSHWSPRLECPKPPVTDASKP